MGAQNVNSPSGKPISTASQLAQIGTSRIDGIYDNDNMRDSL